jgi:hypothetical protein
VLANSACVDLVIRTYYKDLEWLEYCLRSIRRYATGFRSVIVVIPRASEGAYLRRRIVADHLVICQSFRDDYLGQQVTKLYSDEYTDADYIAHLDADTVFIRPVSPGDLFYRGRPYILMTP